MDISKAVLALTLLVGSAGSFEKPAYVPTSGDCGACRNGFDWTIFGFGHRFRIEMESPPLGDELALSLESDRLPLPIDHKYRTGPKPELGPLLKGRPTNSLGGPSRMTTSDAMSAEYEEEGPAYIVYCSTDLGCHNYWWVNDCGAHNDCLVLGAVSDFLEEFSDRTPTVIELSNALAAAPNSLHVNFRRSSVQVTNCKGAVVANIPLPAGTLALASARAFMIGASAD